MGIPSHSLEGFPDGVGRPGAEGVSVGRMVGSGVFVDVGVIVGSGVYVVVGKLVSVGIGVSVGLGVNKLQETKTMINDERIIGR